MGKRKASKTAKKKKAKAASRASAKNRTAAFGVTVVKGSKGRGRQDNSNSSFSGENNAQSGTTKKAGKSSFGSSSFATSADQLRVKQKRRAIPNTKEERQDFDRAYASLQERADVKQQQKRSGKGKKRSSKQSNQQQISSALFSNLADSSVKLGPATVGEMVDDAADRVAAGMSEIGQQISPLGKMPSAPPNTPSVPRSMFGGAAPHQQTLAGEAAAAAAAGQKNPNLLQVLAAQKRKEWAAQKYTMQPEPQSQVKGDSLGDNRYAFLGNGDSDDDDGGWGAGDGGSALQPATAPAFQFAPPSFSAGDPSFAGGRTDATENAGNEVDHDPDL
mmetsp:Transcript_22104/g.45753  ORF Transcript_22104/g.45753 Transcript_22104/m.45753 type:complete len:332 (-) Transcript_22104:2078-3073(-)